MSNRGRRPGGISIAGGGIGAAPARHYAAAGVRLTVTGRNEERLAIVVHGLEASGAGVRAVWLSMTGRWAMAVSIAETDAVCAPAAGLRRPADGGPAGACGRSSFRNACQGKPQADGLWRIRPVPR
ncbi:MAG: hypothetical protein GDA47_03490 [Rhodospirillales bacterium]|nr:hypothetical protein [Rhodospirillales bacterium]